MRIIRCDHYEDMSSRAAREVLAELQGKGPKSLCIASGRSPLGLYRKLVGLLDKEPDSTHELRVIKLDEWGGTDPADPSSGEYYLRKEILDPLRVEESRYIGFKNRPDFPEQECSRILAELQALPGKDICILGLGKNGHLGFNEPGRKLQPFCHVARLTEKTMQHSMALSMKHTPAYGLTLGMADIMGFRKIILVISGDGKEEATRFLLSKQVSTYLPASLLWLHPNTSCYLDCGAGYTGS